MNKTNILIDYLFKIKDLPLTNTTQNQVKRCLLDYLGVTYAGAKLLDKKINCILKFSDNQTKDISVIGLTQKTDIFTATFINGLNSHVAELDDGSRYGAIHPGSPIFSTLLPLAEKEKSSSCDFVKAVVLAYETAILLSSAIQPSHYKMGFHPTSTCGSIGAAVGAAILLGYTRKQLKATFSTSVISAYGTLKVIENGSELKPYNAGSAALNGLMASIVGCCDFSPPDDVLSGKTGFFSMMSRENSYLDSFEHDTPLIHKVYFKPYAACRHAHPSIEAALKIRSSPKHQINKITRIIIKTYQGVIGKHDATKITNPYSAKMSIPYTVAVALKYGSVNIEDFTEENIHDNEILALIDKTFILADSNLSNLVPHKRVAIVEVEYENGYTLRERIDFPKGEPENPMTDIEIIDKFKSLAFFAGKSIIEIDEIIENVWNMMKKNNN